MQEIINQGSLLAAAALTVPVTFVLAALLSTQRSPFRLARLAAAGSVVLALVLPIWHTLAGLPRGTSYLRFGAHSGLGVRLDPVGFVALALVCFLAVIIVAFSRTYLRGDPGQLRYARWLMATLAAVTFLILSSNLLLIGLAWTVSSLSLHQLLTYYRERRQATVAAHKKFLLSRLAELCLFSALLLLYLELGSLELDALDAWASSHAVLPLGASIAAVLIALCVSLKCAQLPFHGWLIQVTEAPTPVSALLHAGVVNIGGLLLIRLAPWMSKAELAQLALVVIGCSTVLGAGLVMATRTSVKVALAWSTSAQMGLMLAECGLGLYELALLHLVGHSLYKAHAFLRSGSALQLARARALRGEQAPPALAAWLIALPLSLLAVTTLVASAGWSLGALSSLAMITVLSCALASTFVQGLGSGMRGVGFAALVATGTTALYLAWHTVFASAIAVPVHEAGLMLRLALWMATFALLFVVQGLLITRPHGGFARALRPHLAAGLHLDELFTRLTFRLWPPRLPVAATKSFELPEPSEV